jgi:predicted nucleic acid-binding protein
VSDYADAVLARLEDDTAVVPSLWPLEVANGLVSAERRRRLTAAGLARAVELSLALPIDVQAVPVDLALVAVLELARRHGLTAYDAAYLDLAMRQGLPLATEDAALRGAAGRVGVSLLEG